MVMKTKLIRQRISIPEVLKHAGEEDSVEDKITVLKYFDDSNLRWFINSLYNWDWVNRMVIPPHKPSEIKAGLGYISFKKATEILTLAYHSDDQIFKSKKIIQVLENVDCENYRLFIMMLENKRQIQGIHKSVFKKAYPQFFRLEATDEIDVD